MFRRQTPEHLPGNAAAGLVQMQINGRGRRNDQPGACQVVASGKGVIAERIIDTAKKSDVPLYKDTDLTNTLLNLDIGECIPPELYGVVAEILVYVDRMDKLRAKLGK